MDKKLMRAAVLAHTGQPLAMRELPIPELQPAHTLVRVLACGVCRTDLHIADGELPPRVPDLIPGHQIVGEVIASDAQHFAAGTRVGVSWLGGTGRKL